MGTKRELPILSVVGTGSQTFPRYLISDARNRVWTGHDFGLTGVLYAKHEAAACDIHNILKGHFEGVEPVRYAVPLVVEVFSNEPIHVAEVARHLSRASRLYLNTAEYGNGPRNSLVLPTIEWHRIEAMKESTNE